MKKYLLLITLITVYFTSHAKISWMGNHATSGQPSSSQSIHFYVEMFDDYTGCHAEVKINEGGTWVSYSMAYTGKNGNNSKWELDLNVKSSSTEYIFHGWDDWGANVYDNNNNTNYTIQIIQYKLIRLLRQTATGMTGQLGVMEQSPLQ